MSATLDFQSVARTALAACPALLQGWFPAGRLVGREFQVGNLHGDPGESLSINVRSGAWSDFAAGQKGGDLVSLYAAMHGIGQGDAFRELSKELGTDHASRPSTAPRPAPALVLVDDWRPVMPAPADAPNPPQSHPKHGAPEHIAEVRAADGALLHLIYRFPPPEGGRKQIVPACWDGNRWVWKGPVVPRPLYGLDRLAAHPNAPVFVVEGEMKRDAAERMLVGRAVVVSWPNGADGVDKADWSPLKDRDVTVWPDADAPGQGAAAAVVNALRSVARSVHLVTPPPGVPKGWDLADAERDGWDGDRVMAAAAKPLPKGPVPLPIVRYGDIQPILDTADFVQGTLVEGSAAVVYGESNAGKTFWTTDLALHVAAGMDWNGRRVEQGGVIYAVLEGGFGFRNRVSAWAKANITDGREVLFRSIPSGLNLLDPDADTPRLIETIKQQAAEMGAPIKLVVVDTLSRAMAGGNENGPEDMGALVRNMDLVRAETGACVLFIHHSGKDAAKGARGHSLLRAALDTEIEVKAEDGTDLKSATTVKQREMRKGDVFAFILETVVLGQNRHGEDVTTCIVKPADVADIPEKKRQLPAGARAALKALTEALAKAGRPANDRAIPENVPVVPVEAWRREFYARSELETQDAKKKAFLRGSKALIECGAAAVMFDKVWIVRAE